MEKLNDLMQVFDVYNPALIALTILCVAVLMQSFLAGVLGFKGGVEVPGQPLKGSHKNFSFRALRTYGNSVENLPVFAITLILAIVADVSPAGELVSGDPRGHSARLLGYLLQWCW